MKAAVYYGIKDIRVEDRPVPEIGKGDILLKVRACAVRGTDLKVFMHGYKNLNPPQIIGHEISGSTAAQIKMCLDLMSGKRVEGKKLISKIITLEELPGIMTEVQKGGFLKIVVKP